MPLWGHYHGSLQLGVVINGRFHAVCSLGSRAGRIPGYIAASVDVRHASLSAQRPAGTQLQNGRPSPAPPAHSVPGLAASSPSPVDARQLAVVTRRVKAALAECPALGGRGGAPLSVYDFVGLLDNWPKELAGSLPGAVEVLLRGSRGSSKPSAAPPSASGASLWDPRVAQALLRTILRFAQEGARSRDLLEAAKQVAAAALPSVAWAGSHGSGGKSKGAGSAPAAPTLFATSEEEQTFLGRYARLLAAYGHVEEAVSRVFPSVITAGGWPSPHLTAEVIRAALETGRLDLAVATYQGLAALDVAPPPTARDALRKAFEAAAAQEMEGGQGGGALPPTAECVALLLAQFPRDSDHPSTRARQIVDALQLLIATAGRGAPSLAAEARLFRAVVDADLDLASVRSALPPPAAAALLRSGSQAARRVVEQLSEAAKARTTRYLMRLNQTVSFPAPAPAPSAAASVAAPLPAGEDAPPPSKSGGLDAAAQPPPTGTPHLPSLLSSFSHALTAPVPATGVPEDAAAAASSLEAVAAAVEAAGSAGTGLAAADAAAAAVAVSGSSDSPLVEDVLAALVNGSRSAEADARRRLAAAGGATPVQAPIDPTGEYLDDPDFALLHSGDHGGGTGAEAAGSAQASPHAVALEGAGDSGAAHLTRAVESGRFDVVASQHVAELLAFAASQARALDEGVAPAAPGAGVPAPTRREAIAERAQDLLVALLGRGVHPTPAVLAAYLAVVIQTRSPSRLRPALDFLKAAPPAATCPEAIALYKKAMEENCSRRTALTVYQCVPDLVEFGVRPSPATLSLLSQMATAGWAAGVKAANAASSSAVTSPAKRTPAPAPPVPSASPRRLVPPPPAPASPASHRRALSTLARGWLTASASRPSLLCSALIATRHTPVRASSFSAPGSLLYRGGRSYAPLGVGRAGEGDADGSAAGQDGLTDLEEPAPPRAASSAPSQAPLPSTKPLWGPSRDVLAALPFTGTSTDPGPAGDADISLLLGGGPRDAAPAASTAAIADAAASEVPPLPLTRRRRGREYTPGLTPSVPITVPDAGTSPAPAGGATTPLLQARFWVAPPRAPKSGPGGAGAGSPYYSAGLHGDSRLAASPFAPSSLFTLGSPTSRAATAAAAVASLGAGGLSPSEQLTLLDAVGLGHAVPPSALAYMIKEACGLPSPPLTDILFAWTRLTRHQPALGALPRPLLWSLLRAFVGASQHGAAWDVFMRLFPGHTGSLPRARRMRELVARHFAALKRSQGAAAAAAAAAVTSGAGKQGAASKPAPKKAAATGRPQK